MLKRENEMEVLACCLLQLAGCKRDRMQVRAAINRFPGRQRLETYGKNRRLRKSDGGARESASQPNL